MNFSSCLNKGDKIGREKVMFFKLGFKRIGLVMDYI